MGESSIGWLHPPRQAARVPFGTRPAQRLLDALRGGLAGCAGSRLPPTRDLHPARRVRRLAPRRGLASARAARRRLVVLSIAAREDKHPTQTKLRWERTAQEQST